MSLDKEIIDEFKQESGRLLKELHPVVEKLEEPFDVFPSDLMEEYALKIDGVMGVAKTIGMMHPTHLGLKRIGSIAELCKKLGYKAAELRNPILLPIFAAFWADTLEVIENLIDVLEDDEESTRVAKSFATILQGRLEWLSRKIVSIKKRPAMPGAVPLNNPSVNPSAELVDASEATEKPAVAEGFAPPTDAQTHEQKAAEVNQLDIDELMASLNM